MEAVSCGCSEIVESLLKAGTDANAKTSVSSHVIFCCFWVRVYICELIHVQSGCTVLMKAVKNNQTDIVGLLFMAGADINSKNNVSAQQLVLLFCYFGQCYSKLQLGGCFLPFSIITSSCGCLHVRMERLLCCWLLVKRMLT